jgi:hypothetical protein
VYEDIIILAEQTDGKAKQQEEQKSYSLLTAIRNA